jgi:hypothetical protein
MRTSRTPPWSGMRTNSRRARAERLGVEADAELVDQMLEALTEAWDTVQARGT